MREPITITILNNEVCLEHKCWVCDGGEIKYSKKAPHQGFWTKGVCNMCEGRKYVLTEVGEAIVELVKQHLSIHHH